ncbi:myosin heavy chain, clone 203-like isoform X2 [Argopecten irradians]|uniref:myosin heavy chain, clone 203-like isoform X2 n=1 Tax=Argopecten irradians TaxID=31199 RepID=UPI00371D2901
MCELKIVIKARMPKKKNPSAGKSAAQNKKTKDTTSTESSEPSNEFMAELESEHLKIARAENDELRTKIGKLESELKKAKTGDKLQHEGLTKERVDYETKVETFTRRIQELNTELEKEKRVNSKLKNNTKTDDKPELVNNLGIHQLELKNVKEQRDNFQKQLNDMTKERDKLQTDVELLQSTQNTQRKTRDSDQESKIENLSKEKDKLQKLLDDMTKERDKLQTDVELLQSTQNTQRKTRDSDQESKIENLSKEKDKLQKLLDDMTKERDRFQKQLDGMTKESPGQKKDGDSSSAKKISRLEEEVEGLRNRLSKIAGAQLTDNNPAIADLSDPNRPLSLGEKFSELYDNEWTDAMEELSDSSDEREVIRQLLEIVVDSYQFCCKRSNEFMDRINGTMEKFSGNSVSEMPKEILKTNKDFRKSLAVHCVYHLQEEFTKLKSRGNAGKKTKAYMKKCVQVCWFMTVQDPKVVINHNVTDHFDEDRFKAYTKKGKQVDYLVWPALHLHEGGPMIGKGVAQGK